VLFCKALAEGLFVKAFFDQVVIGRALSGQDRTAIVNKGQNYRSIEALVLGLNMICNAAKFDVGIESGYHGLSKECESFSTAIEKREAILKLAHGAKSGQHFITHRSPILSRVDADFVGSTPDLTALTLLTR
jgi:hypothetical protein